MARRKCPSCGAWYDGKKCRECLFELFEDEEKHDHYHGVFGEPSPYTAPTAQQKTASPVQPKAVRNPVPVQFPPRTAKKSRSTGLRRLPVILVFVIFMAITGIYSVVSQVSREVDRWTEEEIAASQTQVTTMPEDAPCIYAGNGVTVKTLWQPGDPIEGDIVMVVENLSRQDITVSSYAASVNGIMTDAVFFYGAADAGEDSEANLWIDMQALNTAGISVIEDITLYLQAYDSDSYELLDTGTYVTLKTSETARLIPVAPAGTELCSSDGFLLRYLGWQKTENGEYAFLFYGENNRQQAVSLYSTELSADGEETDIYLWQDFLPNTRAWFSTLEDDLSKTAFASPEEIEQLSFSLEIEDTDTYEDIFSTELQFACTP